MTVLTSLRARYDTVAREAAKFGVVGALCYVVDVGFYNLFHYGFDVGPLTSKVLSTVIAASCAFAGNRQWSFRHRERTKAIHHEYLMFFGLNVVGLAIALVFLGFGFYVLDMRSPLATNFWGNLVGTGVGTLFRFWSYRRFVWISPAGVQTAADEGDVVAAVVLDVEDVQDARS